MASPITHVLKIAAEILKDRPAPEKSASALETPMSPPREQKEELLDKFGDPLASPTRGEASGEALLAQEQAEFASTNTPAVVTVVASQIDPTGAEHLTVDLAGVQDHCALCSSPEPDSL